MLIDAILLTTIALFGLWVINKHYDNAYEIEKLQKELRNQFGLTNKLEAFRVGGNDYQTLNDDMITMQNDLTEFRQSLINIDAKYKFKNKWTTEKLQEVVSILRKHNNSILINKDSMAGLV